MHFVCWTFLLMAMAPVYSWEFTYAGLSIPACEWGCDDLDTAGMQNYNEIFSKTFKEIFREADCFLLEDDGWNRLIKPWCYESDFVYQVYDWRVNPGKWKEDNYKIYEPISYPLFQEAVQVLREDLNFYYLTLPVLRKRLNEDLICLLKKGYDEGYRFFSLQDGDFEFDVYNCSDCSQIWNEITDLKKKINKIDAKILDAECKYENANAILDEAVAQIDDIFKKAFVYCLVNHQPEGISFKGAVENFIAGNYKESLDQIHFLIRLAEKQNLGHELIGKLHLIEGQFRLEYGQYAEAVVCLTSAIQNNPMQQEAYFERAVAYFELGEFDKAVQDYLTIEHQPSSLFNTVPYLSAGITVGIIAGAKEAAVEFIPESLSTLRGMGKGLWALLEHPLEASKDFVDAALQIIDYLRSQSSLEIAQNLIPELRELIQNYDQLSHYERGRLIGHAIGKYGADILVCKYSMVALKAYRDLKKANQMMTLEALANPTNAKQIRYAANKVWAIRDQARQNGNLNIHWGRQEKHIPGKSNFDLKANRSVLNHPDPQKLVDKYAGTGIRDLPAQRVPGLPGYKEIVDFEEFIGYVVDEKTGESFATTIGKIHYGKDGVHIVPRKGI